MTSWICLDSGIALKLVLPEEDSRQARDLWEFVVKSGIQPAAPPLFSYEITAVLRKCVYRETITLEYGRAALKKLLRLNIQLVTFPEIHWQAWDLARRLNRPTAYDTHYLALAGYLNCEFWTADKRLYNSASREISQIRLLHSFQP
jgi:predicted nucleic acid-binding protein